MLNLAILAHFWPVFEQRPRRRQSPVEHRGNLSAHKSVHPPKFKQNGRNLSIMVKMAQIWSENPISGLRSIILAS